MPDWMSDTSVAFPNLGIYIENLPKSFTVFGVTIALYGVFIAIGVVLALTLIGYVARTGGQNADDYYDMGVWVLLFGIVGARIYYVIFEWQYYKNDLLSVFNIRQGGLAIYGGVIGGVITILLYCRKKGWNGFQKLDTIFTGVLVGQIIGRFGNFTNREVFGGYSDGLFAMRLPVNAVRSRDISEELAAHIAEGTNYIQVHPTFLYESFCNLILLGLILAFRKKKAFEGEMSLWYMGGYGLIRFVMEGIRTDRLKIPGTGIAVSQLLSLILIFSAVILEAVVRSRLKKSADNREEEIKE
ncbi:MAG: prolipoprotein diacylglyceryl transferase [Lachnospiraceae bacterium]|nr:prolipoprotein diacylglyceryl transferase [Lachnospiraceae bacterium]